MDPSIKKALLSVVLDAELRDNQQLRLMKGDGTYERKHPAPGEESVDSQSWFLDHMGIWYHVGP
jgi:polyphosphate kinase